VGSSSAVGQIEIPAVFPPMQPAALERVEHKLAGNTDHVDSPRAIFLDERTGGVEVLPHHDLGRFGSPIFVGAMLFTRLGQCIVHACVVGAAGAE